MSLAMRLVCVLSRSSTSGLLRTIRTSGNRFGVAALLVLQGTHPHNYTYDYTYYYYDYPDYSDDYNF